jgi:hypothetical protein
MIPQTQVSCSTERLPHCGPQRFLDAAGQVLIGDQALIQAVNLVRSGILALKVLAVSTDRGRSESQPSCGLEP